MNIQTHAVYPTMITPYTKYGDIDYDGVKKIVDMYAENGCKGIFAVCQSSEMNFLSLKERIKLAETVVKYADSRMDVVASGHVSSSAEEQVTEVNEISKTGISAFVLVSNRLDLHNDGDDVWIDNAERLLSAINTDIPLGIYECPMPYKRLLTERIIKWCIGTKRFRFIKDTCCDFTMLKKRLELLDGSGCMLFNANAQSLLHSLKCGAAGYSGIMANFHPDLYVWLCENFEKEPEKAEILQAYLGIDAFVECMDYPVTAKYYLKYNGINIDLSTRSADPKNFTEYQRLVTDQQAMLADYVRNLIKK